MKNCKPDTNKAIHLHQLELYFASGSALLSAPVDTTAVTEPALYKPHEKTEVPTPSTEPAQKKSCQDCRN